MVARSGGNPSKFRVAGGLETFGCKGNGNVGRGVSKGSMVMAWQETMESVCNNLVN